MTAMAITRWRYVLAASLALGTFASACSSGDGDSSSGSTAGSVADSVVDSVADTVADSVPDTSAVPTGSSPVVEEDGTALLQAALDELVGSSYHFLTVVSAGGSVALQAEGDHVGDGTRFVVMRDDALVEYVVTPEGTWVMPEGEEWRASDIDSTTANPVPALAAATSVTVESSEGSTVTVVASVPDVALGYEGDGAKDVTVTLLDGRIDKVQYDTTVQGLAASLLTRISPVTDDAAVVAPI